MVTIEQLKSGVSAYMDAEIVPKLPGWRQWVFGGAMALAIANAEQWLAHPVVAALGVVKDGMVDVESIYREIRSRASGPFQINVPGIGEMTFRPEDIDKLYQTIVR